MAPDHFHDAPFAASAKQNSFTCLLFWHVTDLILVTTLRDYLSSLYPARIPLQLGDKVLLLGEEPSSSFLCTTHMHVQVRVVLVEVASSLGNQVCLTVDHVTSVSFSLSSDLGALLLCPGMYPLATASQEAESSRKLTHLLNAVTDALVWVIGKSGISSQQQSVRLANLLMLLSHVRHIRYKPVGRCSSGVWAEHVLGALGTCRQVCSRYGRMLEWEYHQCMHLHQSLAHSRC